VHSVARTRPTGPAHVRTGIGVGPAAGLDESRAAGAARSAVEGHARAGRTPTHTRRGADARAVDGDRNSKRMTPGRGSRFGPIPRRSRAHGRVDPVPQSPVPLLCAAAVAPWRMSGAPGTGPWVWRRPAALLLDARSSLPLRTTRRTRAREALWRERSSGLCWAARGGPRILRTTSLSVIIAISLRATPQSGHVRTSTANTRSL